MSIKSNIAIVAGVAFVGIGAIWGLAGVTTIEPGEVGLDIVMIETLGEKRGISENTLNTGVRWIEPLTHDVVIYDTRDHQYKLYSEQASGMSAATKDGQPIAVDVSLQIGLIDKNVPTLHESVGKDYFNQIVYPAARSIVREHTSRQFSDEIYTGKGREIVQAGIQKDLKDKLTPLGIRVEVNLRDVQFTNAEFNKSLEDKAVAAQRVTIEERNAEAAIQVAKGVENTAEGQKQKRIKSAEADRQERILKGQGQRLQKEEEAKGILAMAKAKAEGTRLQVLAYGSGKTYASVKWAENLAPKLTVWGVPTGSPGTGTMMDLNGMLKGAFAGKVGK